MSAEQVVGGLAEGVIVDYDARGNARTKVEIEAVRLIVVVNERQETIITIWRA